MTTAPPLPAVAHFASIIKSLVREVHARGFGPQGTPGLLEQALCDLIKGRIQRILARFMALAAKIQAGTLTPPRVRTSPRVADAGMGAVVKPGKPRAGIRLPDRWNWLRRYVPQSPQTGSTLDWMFHRDPEFKALVEADPRMGRILRPLFRMLGAPGLGVKNPGYRPAKPPPTRPPSPVAPMPGAPMEPTSCASLPLGCTSHPTPPPERVQVITPSLRGRYRDGIPLWLLRRRDIGI